MTAARDTPGPPGTGQPDPTSLTLTVLLLHAGKLLEDRVRENLDRLGLHPAQGHVLHRLGLRDGVRQGDLTRAMRVSAPTISGVLSRMERAGLITRTSDADDDRVVRVWLTPSGRETAGAVRCAIEQAELALIAGLSRPQLRAAHSLLRRLRDNLGGCAPHHEPPVSRVVP